MSKGTMRAVYKDGQGAAFSCPVVVHDGSWVLVTSDGSKPITYYFEDDAAGRLEFVEYREEPEPADLRLHINRLPGESSFGSLQRAYAEKEIVEQRKYRLAARQEMQDVPVDPTKIQEARRINNEFAQVKRPRS